MIAKIKLEVEITVEVSDDKETCEEEVKEIAEDMSFWSYTEDDLWIEHDCKILRSEATVNNQTIIL